MDDLTRYFDHLPLDAVARLAPDSPEAHEYLMQRMRPEAPHYPPHGERVGWLELSLHTSTCRAELLSTGNHCRSFGILIDGHAYGPMGIDRAFSELVSPAVRRPFSIRHLHL